MGGGEDIVQRSLNLDPRRRWSVRFTPRLLYPKEGASGTHWIGDWVGPRADIDAVTKRNPFLVLPWIEPWSSMSLPSYFTDCLLARIYWNVFILYIVCRKVRKN